MVRPKGVASLWQPRLLARSPFFTESLGRELTSRGRRSFCGYRKPTLKPAGIPGHLSDVLKVSEEVAHALATNQPVVALESTIYTHGAIGRDLGLESIVRRNGGVPALCGVFHGTPTVGLSEAELEQMVQEGAKKVSRRDLAFLVGTGAVGERLHGGTTIAGTMILARLAGIRVFGTGGLGGVHRGGQDSLDISADLTELGRTRVSVVSSGCKGFLDIPRTLEFLETQGVLVSTFADGRDRGSVDFPAFWARQSGIRSPSVVQDEKQAASVILAQERLDIESGLLFANPIPEEFAIPREEMEAAIAQAVREAAEKGMSGSENTPFILSRLKELTLGATIPANIALVRANVRRATRIAVELCQLQAEAAQSTVWSAPAFVNETKTRPSIEAIPVSPARKDMLVAGSIALDLSCDYSPSQSGRSNGQFSVSPSQHTSNPASIRQSVGGVGHNVALAAHRASTGMQVGLCSILADDVAGATVLSALQNSGLDTANIRQLSHKSHANRTAQYVAVNDAEKNLVLAMADMDIFTQHSFPDHWEKTVTAAQPKWIVVDANWSTHDIHAWIRTGRQNNAHIAYEPVSVEKAARLFAPSPSLKHHGGGSLGVFPNASVDLATPNQYELASLYEAARKAELFDDPAWFGLIDALGMRGARDRFVRLTSAELTDKGIPVQTVQLLPYIPTIVTKLGAHGALLTSMLGRDDPRLHDPACAPYILARSEDEQSHVGGIYMRLFPPVERVDDVVSVNGVGDTFLGVLVAGLAQGGRVENLIDVAQKAAVLTLRSPEAVSEELSNLQKGLASAAAQR